VGAASADSPPIAVALSGGNDSVALLACARDMAHAHRLRLRAIHIHHGLQQAADGFDEFCRRLCASLDVPLTVVKARVARARGESLEARAREARYAAFAASLEPGELLLLAQHADDQLETVLLQLLRGTGLPGLAGMRPQAVCGKGTLLRPLLALRRAELEAFRSARGLEALEDPMNMDLRFDRSFLRQVLLPELLARWPGAVAAIGRAARNAAEAQSLLAGLAAADLAPARDGAALDARCLRALTPARRRNALRSENARRGLPLPDSARLAELCGPMLDARRDAAPFVEWPGVRVRRELDRISLEAAPRRSAEHAAREEVTDGAIYWSWKVQETLTFAPLQGVLRIQPDRNGPLDLERLPAMLEVRRRAGGERLRPRRNGPRRALKALLSEARLPRAERAALPLVYAGGQLIAVADHWIDASVQASDHTVCRGRLSWRSGAQEPA